MSIFDFWRARGDSGDHNGDHNGGGGGGDADDDGRVHGAHAWYFVRGNPAVLFDYARGESSGRVQGPLLCISCGGPVRDGGEQHKATGLAFCAACIDSSTLAERYAQMSAYMGIYSQRIRDALARREQQVRGVDAVTARWMQAQEATSQLAAWLMSQSAKRETPAFDHLLRGQLQARLQVSARGHTPLLCCVCSVDLALLHEQSTVVAAQPEQAPSVAYAWGYEETARIRARQAITNGNDARPLLCRVCYRALVYSQEPMDILHVYQALSSAEHGDRAQQAYEISERLTEEAVQLGVANATRAQVATRLRVVATTLERERLRSVTLRLLGVTDPTPEDAPPVEPRVINLLTPEHLRADTILREAKEQPKDTPTPPVPPTFLPTGRQGAHGNAPVGDVPSSLDADVRSVAEWLSSLPRSAVPPTTDPQAPSATPLAWLQPGARDPEAQGLQRLRERVAQGHLRDDDEPRTPEALIDRIFPTRIANRLTFERWLAQRGKTGPESEGHDPRTSDA